MRTEFNFSSAIQGQITSSSGPRFPPGRRGLGISSFSARLGRVSECVKAAGMEPSGTPLTRLPPAQAARLREVVLSRACLASPWLA